MKNRNKSDEIIRGGGGGTKKILSLENAHSKPPKGATLVNLQDLVQNVKHSTVTISSVFTQGPVRGEFRQATRPQNSDTRAMKWRQMIDDLSKF